MGAFLVKGCHKLFIFNSRISIEHDGRLSSLLLQAVNIKLLGSLNREDLKKLCGDNYPEWISFPAFEQVNSSLDGLYSSIV